MRLGLDRDSLGEYLAVAVSLEDLAAKTQDERVGLLASTLGDAISGVLTKGNSPSRKVNELDNRGTSFYLALYWAQAMAPHDEEFAALAEQLEAAKPTILEELVTCQGGPVDLGGYYRPCASKAAAAMRPSSTFNHLIDSV